MKLQEDSHLNLPDRIHKKPLPEIKIGDTIFTFHDFEKTDIYAIRDIYIRPDLMYKLWT